jgi:Kef-type K+ transport system membrane component KefB
VAALKRGLRTLLWQSLMHTVVMAVGMGLAFFLLARFGLIDFLKDAPTIALVAAAAVWGAFATSKSPAATLAILKETRSKGPLSEVGLGVVVLFDVIVLVLFAAAVMFAQSALTPGGSLSLETFQELGVELTVSVAAGVTYGLIIALYFFAVGKEPLLFLLVTAYGVTAFCTYFHYDTLLVFAMAGFVVTNMSRQGEKLVKSSEQMGAAVMVVFFATAGAHLDLGILKSAWPIALGLAGGRILLTWVSSTLAHRAARDEGVVKKYTFMSLISQAGVAIGLATIAGESLGEMGAGIATLAIAVVGINEMIGPILFKIALGRAGELGKAVPGENAHH